VACGDALPARRLRDLPQAEALVSPWPARPGQGSWVGFRHANLASIAWGRRDFSGAAAPTTIVAVRPAGQAPTHSRETNGGMRAGGIDTVKELLDEIGTDGVRELAEVLAR